MILSRSGKETWINAAVRYGALEGIAKAPIVYAYTRYLDEGYSERRAAYLALAQMGVVDDVAQERDPAPERSDFSATLSAS